MTGTVIILGASGFVGRETVRRGLGAGRNVIAVMRNASRGSDLERAGAQVVPCDVMQSDSWVQFARSSDAVIDLVQPPIPKRMGVSTTQKMAEFRIASTERVVRGLLSLPGTDRPLLVFVNGTDDLEPDANNQISHRSALRSQLRGFAHLGVPARKRVEASGLEAAYVYFGNIVYGPGKGFADTYVAGLKTGKARVVGDGGNHLPLTHVDDAAAALIHLSGLPKADVVGKTFVAADGANATQRELLDFTANVMGVKHPGSVPVWLARLVAGRTLAESVTLDVQVDPSALRATGFAFTYPSYREGVPPTLEALNKRSPA